MDSAFDRLNTEISNLATAVDFSCPSPHLEKPSAILGDRINHPFSTHGKPSGHQLTTITFKMPSAVTPYFSGFRSGALASAYLAENKWFTKISGTDEKLRNK
jgi:hypothetical protein